MELIFSIALGILFCAIATAIGGLALEFLLLWLGRSLYKDVKTITVEVTNEEIASGVLLFNSGLLTSLIKRKIENYKKKKEALHITLIGLLIGQKAVQNFTAYILLLLSLTIYCIGSFIVPYPIETEVVGIISVFFVALFVNQKVLGYRVKSGRFGTNEYEAREIINFILNHSNKTDFYHKGKLKDLVPTLSHDEYGGKSRGGEEEVQHGW